MRSWKSSFQNKTNCPHTKQVTYSGAKITEVLGADNQFTKLGLKEVKICKSCQKVVYFKRNEEVRNETQAANP